VLWTETKSIDRFGACSAGQTTKPNQQVIQGAPHIRCHDFKLSAGDSTLCDSYAGVWERNASGIHAQCVESIEYGIDMAAEIVDGASSYCWTSITLLPRNPYTSSGDLHADVDCNAPVSPWNYVNSGGLEYDCDGTPVYSRGGTASGIDITLLYRYDEPQ
jgi:hypothetical protein